MVTLSEAVPSGTGPSVEWGTDPSWSGDGIVPNGDGTATITIGDDTNPQFTVTNDATELRGTFEVAKTVTGDMDLTDPRLAEAVFTVGWTSSDGQSGSFELSAPDWTGGPVTGGAAATFPLGTTVTLSEPTISGTGPGVAWGEISWTPGDQGDGTAVVTISSATEPLAVTLSNEVSELTGTFGVTKALAGDFDFTSPEMQSAEFTVLASWPAGPGLEAGEVELVLNAGNSWSAPAGVQLPTGTVVTLSEAVPSGTGPSVEWGDATWSGEGLTVNEDGTASFVIGDNTAPTFTVTNEVTELFGTFGIAKAVTGDFDLTSPEMAGAQFTVTATWAGGGSQDLVLNQANGWAAGLGLDLPTGTVVTLSEAVPSGTGPSVEWGTEPTWSGDGVVANEDGTATITIGDGTNPQLTVTNEATELRGTFEVAKAVTGDMDLTDPRLAGAVFTVGWTSSDGQTGSFELVSPRLGSGTGGRRGVGDLPAGDDGNALRAGDLGHGTGHQVGRDLLVDGRSGRRHRGRDHLERH